MFQRGRKREGECGIHAQGEEGERERKRRERREGERERGREKERERDKQEEEGGGELGEGIIPKILHSRTRPLRIETCCSNPLPRLRISNN
jgi:hypothetical protein